MQPQSQCTVTLVHSNIILIHQHMCLGSCLTLDLSHIADLFNLKVSAMPDT